MSSKDKKIAQEAVALTTEAIEGMNTSRKLFDIPTVLAFPRSFLKYKDAVHAATSVLRYLKRKDLTTAKARLEAARVCMEKAKKAFRDDQQMHQEIDRELDD